MKKFFIIIITFLFSLNANAEVIKNKLKNELTKKSSDYISGSLESIFPTAEVSLSSGTSDKVLF